MINLDKTSKILLLGGGGHCVSVIDTLLSIGITPKNIGIIDKRISPPVFGTISVIGNDEDLVQLYNEGYKTAFVSVGSVGDTTVRHRLFNMLTSVGFVIPNIIDPTAVIGAATSIGNGVYVGKKVVINAGVHIEDCTIINTGSIIEHNCTIGEFTHIAPSATLCGDVMIGSNTHIGAAAVIKQGIRIGHNSTIGMGSVVVKNISDNCIAYGNPCKEVRHK